MDDLWENAGSSSMTHGILKDADGRSRSLCMGEEPSSGKLLLNLLEAFVTSRRQEPHRFAFIGPIFCWKYELKMYLRKQDHFVVFPRD